MGCVRERKQYPNSWKLSTLDLEGVRSETEIGMQTWPLFGWQQDDRSHLCIPRVKGGPTKFAWSWKSTMSQQEQCQGLYCSNKTAMWQNHFPPNSNLLPESSPGQRTIKKRPLIDEMARGGGTYGFHYNDTDSTTAGMTVTTCSLLFLADATTIHGNFFHLEVWLLVHLQLVIAFITLVLLTGVVAQARCWKREEATTFKETGKHRPWPYHREASALHTPGTVPSSVPFCVLTGTGVCDCSGGGLGEMLQNR